MLFPKPSFVLCCFFYVSSESLQTKLKSNLQNNYTKQQFNVSPGVSDQLKSEIPVAPVTSVWPNIEVGRDFDRRTLKHGSKKKMKKDSQIEPKTKKSSPRISNFQRFGISYSRTTSLKKATTKKAGRGGGVGMASKRGSNLQQKKGSKIKPKKYGSSPNRSPFQRFGISDSRIKARKKATPKKGGGEGRLPKYGAKPGQIGSPQIETADKDSQQFRRFGLSGSSNKTKKNAKSIKKQGSNPKKKKRSRIKLKTNGSSSKISPFQRFGISKSRIKARKKATTKKAGREGTTPKQGSHREQKKASQVGPGNKMRSTTESTSHQFRRFGLSDSRNKTKKTLETMKTGGEGKNPKHGLNQKQKTAQIEPGDKGSITKSPSQQFRRFGLSDSRNKTRKNDKTGKKEPNEMGSLQGEIPEDDSEDVRREFSGGHPDNSGSGSAPEDYIGGSDSSNDYSGDSVLPNDYSRESSPGDIDDIIDQHTVSKTHSRDMVPRTIANTTLHSQYAMCLDRCSVITAKLSGNYTGNISVDGIDDVLELLSGNYTSGSSLDAIYDIIVQHNVSKTKPHFVKEITKSTHNMSSIDPAPANYGTRYSHKTCIDRCVAYYKTESNGKSQSEKIGTKVVEMTVSLPVIVHTTPYDDKGELRSNITSVKQTRPSRKSETTASITARRTTKRAGTVAGKGVTNANKTTKDEDEDEEYDEYYNDYVIPTSRISTTAKPQKTKKGKDSDHNSGWKVVVGGNATDTSKNSSREEFSDKPLVCWSCSSIVSFDCEKLESIYGEPPEVNERLITTCKSGYCGYFSWAMDYGYGTEMHQRTCADKPETFCNDSNALLEMINTTSNVRKCSVCNTPLCNNSFLQSINSVLIIVLTFLKTILLNDAQLS